MQWICSDFFAPFLTFAVDINQLQQTICIWVIYIMRIRVVNNKSCWQRVRTIPGSRGRKIAQSTAQTVRVLYKNFAITTALTLTKSTNVGYNCFLSLFTSTEPMSTKKSSIRIDTSILTTEERCKLPAYKNSTVCKFEVAQPDTARKVNTRMVVGTGSLILNSPLWIQKGINTIF